MVHHNKALLGTLMIHFYWPLKCPFPQLTLRFYWGGKQGQMSTRVPALKFQLYLHGTPSSWSWFNVDPASPSVAFQLRVHNLWALQCRGCYLPVILGMCQIPSPSWDTKNQSKGPTEDQADQVTNSPECSSPRLVFELVNVIIRGLEVGLGWPLK